ncbi:D-alanyl-D-alanine carboxypeptidase family protein [Acinetobacter qingfengensis]|nr:D-alanyl-D-alanine carboxypeptidase family protein [Acinetobacter qingfengensis]
MFSSAQVLNIDPGSVEAQAWIIYDPQSGQIIDEYQSDVERAPASLTKMMVAYLTLKAVKEGKLHLDQFINVPEIITTVHSDESRMHLKPNEQISIQNLLSGLIIMSANDAALTLGVLVAGNDTNFVQLMNSTAHKLGMQHTQFRNPSGITMDGHYSSAKDLAILAQAIVKETPEYLNYSKQPIFNYKDLTHHATNILLQKDTSIDGMKTGYTGAAGYNLALTANRLDPNTNEYRRLIVVVLGTASKQKRAEVADLLLNIAFNYTQTKRLFMHPQPLADLHVINGKQNLYRILLPQNLSYNTLSLLPQNQVLDAKQFDQITQRFVIHPDFQQILEPLKSPQQINYHVELTQPQLHAPLQQTAMTIAKVDVSQFGRIIHQVNIQQDVLLEQASWWHRLLHWIKALFGLNSENLKPILYPIQNN